MSRRLPLLVFALLTALAVCAPPLHARPLTPEEEELQDLTSDQQFAEAIQLADRLLAAEPESILLHKARMFCFLNDVRLDPMPEIERWRARLKTQPLDRLANTIVLYAEISLAVRIPDAEKRHKEYERLRDRAKELVADGSKDAEVHALAARIHSLILSEHETALAIQRAIDLDPGNVSFRISIFARSLPGGAKEANRKWLADWARGHPSSPLARGIRKQAALDLPGEAEQALALEALLPDVIGTRQEDDVRLALARMRRRADEHLEAILALGRCSEQVSATKLKADRLRGVEGVWTWFSTQDVREENLRRAIAFLTEAEGAFPAVPGDLLVGRAKCHYLLVEYAQARECLQRIEGLGPQETRTFADNQHLIGDSWYAEENHEQARKAYDRVLEGNADFPIPSRFRHLECMVRQNPLIAVAQGSTIFLIFLSVLLSVAIVAARLKSARGYFRLAGLVAALVTALELFLYLVATPEWGAGALMVAIVGFFKNFFLVTAGMLLAARGGVRPFATLRDLRKVVRGRVPAGWARRTALQAVAIVACWAGLLGMTLGLFWQFQPRANEAVKITKSLESASDREQAKAAETDDTALLTLLVVAAAMEEVLFRWFLLGLFQAYLRRFGWSVCFAIFLTALLWGVGHLGAVDPWWFRLVHTTFAGLILGWLRWRHGLESSFLVHSSYNLTQHLLGKWMTS